MDNLVFGGADPSTGNSANCCIIGPGLSIRTVANKAAVKNKDKTVKRPAIKVRLPEVISFLQGCSCVVIEMPEPGWIDPLRIPAVFATIESGIRLDERLRRRKYKTALRTTKEIDTALLGIHPKKDADNVVKDRLNREILPALGFSQEQAAALLSQNGALSNPDKRAACMAALLARKLYLEGKL